MAGDFGEDDPTVIDGAPFETDTPVSTPSCVECGAIVFDDDFDEMALAIGLDRCVRSKAGATQPWYWCASYSPTHRKLVQFVPR